MGDYAAELILRFSGYDKEELVRVARFRDELTDEAQVVLQAEFARRGLALPEQAEADEEMEERQLVTVARYRDLSEAIVARSMLESSGMVVFLQDENLVRLDWQISNFIGGIRLQVEKANEATAREMLTQLGPEVVDFAGDEGVPAYTQPACPKCGSADVSFRGTARGPAITALYLLAVPLPTGPKTWGCNACGTRWADSEDDAADPVN